MKRHECCCGECVEYEDGFYREDTPAGTGWGSGWDHSNGTGNIESDRGKLTAGYMIFNQSLPDSQGSGLLNINFYDSQDGDIYDVYMAWNNPSEYLVARFRVNDPWWEISIRKAGGNWVDDHTELIPGCGTHQQPFLAGGWAATSYDRTIFRVGGTTPEAFAHYELWNCLGLVGPTVNKVGVGHGGGPRALYFDNLWISDHYAHDRTCPFYGCVCQA